MTKGPAGSLLVCMLAVFLGLWTAGATAAGDSRDAVVYGIGISTDTYGQSHPRGFGVATGILDGGVAKDEIRSLGLGWYPWPSWLDTERIVVPQRAPFLPPLIFRFRAGALDRVGRAPLRRLELRAIWSPDATRIAIEPAVFVDCGQGARCTRDGGVVYVARSDGSRRRLVWRGHLVGWAPDGRLLVSDRLYTRYFALNLPGGSTREVVPRQRLQLFARVRGGIDSKPIWSADRRFIAAYASFFWPKKVRRQKVNTFVIARADGRVIRLVSSRYVISMLTWSPVGHRLAYTTSGFPNPHELFVLDEPGTRPRKIFGTSARHFDWVTWSPEGRHLLLDDANWGFDPGRPGRRPPGRWMTFDVATGNLTRELARLGGRPIWCCPEGSYVTR